MGLKRYHVYVAIAFLIPTLISLYLASLCGTIWLAIPVFIFAWILSFTALLLILWKLVIWWNRRKRAESSKLSH